MAVAARATRWAPERTRSTRAILNVLSPVPTLAACSFRFDDTIQSRGRDDPGPIVLGKRRLGNGRDLARVLLRLPRRTLSRLVRRVFVRHKGAGSGARAGSRRGGSGRRGSAGAQRPGDGGADDTPR